MEYYPIVKNWRKIKPHINNEEVQKVLKEDFGKYTMGLWSEKFDEHKTPSDYESCDWAIERIGRRPEFWKYVKHSACHWLVNFNLKLAILAEPKREWRIITSVLHSTVWDGKDTLFDFNFTALRVDPAEAFKLANKKQMKCGEMIKVHLAIRRH